MICTRKERERKTQKARATRFVSGKSLFYRAKCIGPACVNELTER